MKNAKKATKKAPAVLMTVPVSEAESDRRLRPVLDALYSHKSKQALKHVQQAIQKRPGWPAARALRACALMQSEHWAEAEQEITEIRADLDAGRVPLDEDCARKLHMYYLEMRREDIAGGVYEQAWKTDPANFRLAEVAFCLYVRGSAFTAAQKLATKLHRIASATTQKYGMWATAALWVGLKCKKRQGQPLDTTLDAQMLKLASAMLSKALDSSPTPSAETVRFALRVYKDAGEFGKARDLISRRRLVMDEAEMLHLRAELKTSDNSCEMDYRTLLSKHDVDDWGHWLKFFACIGQNEGWHTHALDFVNKAISVELASEKPKRGPFLAQMELQYGLEELQNLSEAVVQYFRRFGAKTICAHDLRRYLNAIRECEWFVKVFDDLSGIVEEEGDAHHLTLSWLRLWFGFLDESAETLFVHYSRHVSEETEHTERQVGDDYLLLAAHKLLPDVCDTDTDRYENVPATLQALVILEAGLSKSPYNFHIKMLLMRLYMEIGAIERVAELWQSLEVKHVLISTLMHLVLHPFFDSGHHDVFQGVLESVEGLWRECDQEIPECTTRAFQVGSINAGVEFVLFRKRLERSAVLAQCMVTEILHNLVITGGEGIGVRRAFNCITSLPRFTIDGALTSKTLIANEDLNCFRFWDVKDRDSLDRLQILDNREEEEGALCSSIQQETIAADLSSLEVLLRIAVKDENSERNGKSAEETDAMLSRLLEKQLAFEVPQPTMLRLKIAANLLEVKQLLKTNDSRTPTSASGDKSREPTDVIKSAQAVARLLVTQVHSMIGASEEEGKHMQGHENGTSEGLNGEAKRFVFSPKQLQKCGRMVFDTLLVSCVAIVSFSPELVAAKRRAKKAASKSGTAKDPSTLSNAECARQAISEYQRALISVGSTIQTWITSCIEQGLDWTASSFTEASQLNDSVSFIPDPLSRLDLADGTVRYGEELGRSEFCDAILAQISSSHAKTCQATLETLTKIITRLKLADL